MTQKSLSFAQDSLLYHHVCLCSDGGAAAAVPGEDRGAASASRGAGSGTGMGGWPSPVARAAGGMFRHSSSLCSLPAAAGVAVRSSLMDPSVCPVPAHTSRCRRSRAQRGAVSPAPLCLGQRAAPAPCQARNLL